MSTAHAANAMHKTIKLRQLFTLGVGTIVGVAWLMVLGTVIAGAGPIGAVIAFVVGAVAMIPIALCYAEISGALPYAGGEIVYAFEIFGVGLAYVAGLCLAFIYIINCVFFAVSVGWLVNKLIPGIEGAVLYSLLGEQLRCGDVVIGVVGTVLIAVAHFRGAKTAVQLQDWATYALLIATCIFVIAGFMTGDLRNLRPWVVPANWAWGAGGVLGVLAMTPYFFGGFNTIPQALSELQDSRGREKIAGLLVACLMVSLLFYCLVIVAVSMVLPRPRLLSFDLPVAEAFAAAFKSRALANLVLFAGLVGLIAVWNALFFAATRVLYALGRGYMLHSRLGVLDGRRGSPTAAIVLVSVLTLLGIVLGKSVLLPVVNVTSTLFALMYVIVTVAVLRYRTTGSDVARSFRVPGGTFLVRFGVVFSAYLVCLSLYQQYQSTPGTVPVEWVLLLIFGGAGAVFWRLSRSTRGQLSEAARRKVILEIT